jgi:hydroxymethylglutaryl-CoA lyase
MSAAIRLVEVGPRDGLQNEKTPVSVAARIGFIEALIGAGLHTVEVGAFVSPKAIPQMVNSDQVLRGVNHHPDSEFHVLVPNEKGFEAARGAGAGVIAVFASASEGFSRANINCSVAESIERFKPVIARAKADGIRVRGYVSCVLGCPFDGEIRPQAVVDVARALWDLGCYEVSLGDTIGVGTPVKARQLLRAVAGAVPMAGLAMHFHDTYGQALANLYAGMEEGARVIDSAAGGLGGCPYAPGATGNVATEDVVYMLEGMGIATGVDMAKLVDASNEISRLIGRPPVSRVAAAVNAKKKRVVSSEQEVKSAIHYYLPPSGPITRSGSMVEISGTRHSTTTAAIISNTNGSVPQITSLSGISGATLRITNRLRPTGG